LTLVLIAASCVLSSACGGSSPTNPAPAPVGYEGEWSGTTFQGRSISFTVSREQQVTAISVGYQIDSCSGVETFSNVNAPFAGPPAPGFNFAATLPDKRVVQIQAFPRPDAVVWGFLLFYGPPSCGPSETVAGPFETKGADGDNWAQPRPT
jgi:hypothetical protein